MLRAALAAVLLATAYCGAKGPPQPPAAPSTPSPTSTSTSTSTSVPDSGAEPPATRMGADAGSP